MYKVLAEECIYQDDWSEDYVQYCDDGYLRSYTVNEYNQPKLSSTLPQWKTKAGNYITTKDVDDKHRANILNLLNTKLDAAISEIDKARLQCLIISFSK